LVDREYPSMSLHPHPLGPVPEQTTRVARAAFPRGNLYLRLRDEIGPIFSDIAFAPLFPPRGQPAEAPWRLALITLFQYAENLSDRQTADAVRARIDWKYALGLELTDTGFDSTVLSEFRTRLVHGSAEAMPFDTLLATARERKWLTARGRQRTDSTHVLGVIRALNRLEAVVETMRHALNALAVAAPDWLRAHSRSEWVDRYGPRADDYRLPKNKDERQACADLVGRDGHELLDAIFAPEALAWLRQVPAVEALQRVWIQQYYRADAGVHWRTTEGLPPSSLFLSSPYDTEAHYAKKRSTSWIGYKVHLTETCDEGAPHLITHVETTLAPMADSDATTPIHRALASKGLLPSLHLVDTGYTSADLLVSSPREHGVELLGPVRGDYRRQAREAKGFAASDFLIDWERKQATCPAGRTSASWTPARDSSGRPVIKVKFARGDCRPCRHRADCTRTRSARRTLSLRPQEQHMALQAVRQRQDTPAFAEQHGTRAGIEGTISQGVRALGLRRARYVGKAKTHLQHLLTAAAINLVRIGRWLANEPLAQTRRSRFVVLMAPQAA
jgi:transposase